ncbi:hypothetical protein ACI0YO_003593 [Cronobacter sakazakii]|uniref:hypothetical protein n=1 Tax=Cronobacter sakazakii TaxID=28141 RepID=UPI001C0B2DE7|nr:hypothetical protein [Cronobacter sakazakii]
MPDLKIVELKPSKEADNNNDGSVLDCWHNGGRPYVMVGAMESLRLDFINANIERR